MLQVHTCVSVHCVQCGDGPDRLGCEAHWPTETAALDGAMAQGWRVGPGGLLLCSACAPVLTCEAEGHEFSEWRHPATPHAQHGSEYRHCRRCCLHEPRAASWLLGELAEQGEPTAMPTALLADAGADAGEVA